MSDAYSAADQSEVELDQNDAKSDLALLREFQAARKQLSDSLARVEFWRRNVEAYDKEIIALQTQRDEAIRTRVLLELVDDLCKYDKKGFFLNPVTLDIAPGYHDIIKEPIDLGTMRANILNAKYKHFESFIADLGLMFHNCKTYNKPDTIVAEAGIALEKQAWELIIATPELAHLVPHGKLRVPKVQKRRKSPPWTFQELSSLPVGRVEHGDQNTRMSTRHNS